MDTYIFSFFFNLIEKKLSRVQKNSTCCENGLACLRKGKLLRCALYRFPSVKLSFMFVFLHVRGHVLLSNSNVLDVLQFPRAGK